MGCGNSKQVESADQDNAVHQEASNSKSTKASPPNQREPGTTREEIIGSEGHGNIEGDGAISLYSHNRNLSPFEQRHKLVDTEELRFSSIKPKTMVSPVNSPMFRNSTGSLGSDKRMSIELGSTSPHRSFVLRSPGARSMERYDSSPAFSPEGCMSPVMHSRKSQGSSSPPGLASPKGKTFTADSWEMVSEEDDDNGRVSPGSPRSPIVGKHLHGNRIRRNAKKKAQEQRHLRTALEYGLISAK